LKQMLLRTAVVVMLMYADAFENTEAFTRSFWKYVFTLASPKMTVPSHHIPALTSVLESSRREKERRYTNSSADNEECRVPTQKSYSSSETLKAFDHDSSRLLYGNRVKDLVHREADEYTRQGSDADTENEAVMSPEHAMRLWGRGVKSGRSSCLSSRSNSALTLTDTEHENKSDSES
ncbi:hypothetical protein A6R68_17506, partial [Neotoma lepida]